MFRVVSDRGLKQYLEEISQYKILSKEDEFALAKRAREHNDTEAKKKLICANLRIVVFINCFHGNYVHNVPYSESESVLTGYAFRNLCSS